MPTYVNRCHGCGHVFETTQAITDDSRPECPECGAETRRLLQTPGIVWHTGGVWSTMRRFADHKD